MDIVDVLRGTANKDWRSVSRGNALPIIARPLGMTHWTLTNVLSNQWMFNPGQPTLASIRCTHQPSPWIGDYGFFDFMPLLGIASRTSKDTYDLAAAVFKPHYVKVKVTSQCVGASCTELELTGTRHGAHVRWRTPQVAGGRSAELQTQLELGVKFHFLEGLSVTVLSATTARVSGWSKKHTVFSPPATLRHYMSAEVEVLGGSHLRVGTGAADKSSLLWSSADGAATDVVMRVGTSFISDEQAARNRDSEMPAGVGFAATEQEGHKDWNALLSRVAVTFDGTPQQAADHKETLYSCMYRALLFPRQLGEYDENGRLVHWSPYDGKGDTHAGPLSTDSGFWDAYRAVYPMLHLVFPDLVKPVLEGWVNAIREDPANMLVQWASPGRVGSMEGSMGEVSLAEGIVNGAITGESAKVAYEYIRTSATDTRKANGRKHLAEYVRNGYVPQSARRDGTVSLSLNYYLTDHVASLAAEAMGDAVTAATLRKRATRWRDTLFDDKTLFFRAKDTSGRFTPFKEFEWMGSYMEGGPWQYRFYLPHDPKGLREAYGGGDPSTLCKVLKQAMEAKGVVSNRQKIHEEVEMLKHSFGQYAHNNQPVHHVLYMFAHAGCPLEGQKWLHHTLATQYGDFGYAGDEDNGEMSSWYILSSFGLYSLLPGSGAYQVGAAPVFKSITIHRRGRAGAGDLIINRETPFSLKPLQQFNPAKTATWNGKNIDLATDAQTIPYNELLKGGTLTFKP